MANPSNVGLWTGADVYIGTVGTATAPTDLTTAWGTGWDVAGILDGAEGFTWEREEESNDYYGWGGVLVKRTRSKHKRTLRFVALEDNPTVFKLVNPGSTRVESDGLVTATIKVPEYEDFALGLELREGSKVKRRFVKRATAEVDGEIKESEEEPTVYSILVTLYPESDGTLFTELSGTVAA